MNPKDKPDKPPGKPDKPPGKPPDGGGTQPPTSVAGAAYGMLLAITQDSATSARKK